MTELDLKYETPNDAKPVAVFQAYNWVSITEQLPEIGVDVLLFDDWKTSDGERRQDMKVGYLSEFTTRKTANGIAVSCEWRGHEFLFNITHWMPLPLPPKNDASKP